MTDISSGAVDTEQLKGKSILITGGASGLGQDATLVFAKAGAYVTIADVQSAEKTVEELNSKGHHVQYVYGDVSSWDSLVSAFKAAIAFSPTKSIDIVAAFAGIDDAGHLIDYATALEPSIDGEILKPPGIRPVQVNLIGGFYTATLALHYAKLGARDTTKCFILVGSLAGYLDDTHDTIYMASKFGARGLFRAIRGRAKDELNLRCNLIAPWAMVTPMTRPVLEKMKDYGIEEGKGITFVKPEIMSNAVVRIAVDDSISGKAFAVVPDGAFDIGDDIEGGYGGPELQRLMKLRKEAGDFLTG